MRFNNHGMARGVGSSDNDVKLNRRLKKKYGGVVEKREVEDCMIEYDARDINNADADYLEHLTSGYISMQKNQVSGTHTIDATDKDPQYEMFWSNLKPYGNSCILEVAEGNGLKAPIIYEAEDVFHEELNQIVEEMSNDTESERRIGEKKGVHCSFDSPIASKDWFPTEDDHSEGPDGLHMVDIQHEERKESRRHVLRSKSNNKKKKNLEANVDSLVDDQYVWWLKGALRAECTDMISEDGPDGLNLKANEHERDNANLIREDRRYALRSGGIVVDIKKETGLNPGMDEYTGLSNVFKFERSKAVHEAKENWSQLCQKRKSICSASSEESDSTRVERDDSSIRIVERDDSSICVGDFHREVTYQFRNEVIKKLREPYSEKEHKTLSDLLKNRKPVSRHIDLRHGIAKFFSGKKEGKSYLDCHPGLRRKLHAAKNDSEKLNLLRGFFFWLQNLTWEGSFQPWTDQECLAVLPEAV